MRQETAAFVSKEDRRASLDVNAMIARGEMPKAEGRSAYIRDALAMIPQHILRSVVSKNAELRANGHRFERRSSRRAARLTQADVDRLVENRDLNLYPLSAFEKLEREACERRRRMLAELL
jgi:hypothetical protein